MASRRLADDEVRVPLARGERVEVASESRSDTSSKLPDSVDAMLDSRGDIACRALCGDVYHCQARGIGNSAMIIDSSPMVLKSISQCGVAAPSAGQDVRQHSQHCIRRKD